MNMPRALTFQATSVAGPKTFSPRTPGSLLKWCLGAGTLGLAFHVFAADPAPAGNTTGTPAAPAAPAAAATTARFDWSKVPPVTAPPRPGMFSIAPSGPGYYSLWDVVTGNERKAPPVAPNAPYALMTTPAFEIDYRYMEKQGV